MAMHCRMVGRKRNDIEKLAHIRVGDLGRIVDDEVLIWNHLNTLTQPLLNKKRSVREVQSK